MSSAGWKGLSKFFAASRSPWAPEKDFCSPEERPRWTVRAWPEKMSVLFSGKRGVQEKSVVIRGDSESIESRDSFFKRIAVKMLNLNCIGPYWTFLSHF